MQKFLTTAQAAKHLGVSRQTLYNRRVAGTGPAFFQHDGIIRYDVGDLDAWLGKKRTSTSQNSWAFGHGNRKGVV